MAAPPYDSVMADNNYTYFAPATSHAGGPRQFEIDVADPLKSGDGVTAYVQYKVKTKTTHQNYSRPFNEVMRRFRDFAWLHDKLEEKNKGVIIPPLPEKNAVQKYQMQTDFIEQRRRALQVFINRVASHPLLKDTRELQMFLEANEEAWMVEMARWQAETAAAHRPVPAAMGWLKSLQVSAANLVSGKSDELMEDAEYLKIRDYISKLEDHLAEVHKQAQRLVRKENALSSALEEFGGAAESLGKHDDGAMAGALGALFTQSGRMAALSKARAESMAADFEAPIKEAMRTIKSVQAAMAGRAGALGQYSQAKSDLDSKKVKLAKLRGTPGLKEDKIAEAERDVNEADQRLRSAKLGYEQIRDLMREELNRFQKERATDMATVLKDFALAQARFAAEQAAGWSSFLSQMQQMQAAG